MAIKRGKSPTPTVFMYGYGRRKGLHNLHKMAGRSKYMPHMSKKELAKAAKRVEKLRGVS